MKSSIFEKLRERKVFEILEHLPYKRNPHTPIKKTHTKKHKKKFSSIRAFMGINSVLHVKRFSVTSLGECICEQIIWILYFGKYFLLIYFFFAYQTKQKDKTTQGHGEDPEAETRGPDPTWKIKGGYRFLLKIWYGPPLRSNCGPFGSDCFQREIRMALCEIL